MPIRAVDLRTEYQREPLGLDETEPRFSWRLIDHRRGARQSAYQVVATRSTDGADLWDSGVVESDETTQISYDGTPLRAFDRASWKVRVWDEDHEPSPWSASAHFEMGPLSIADWEPAVFIQSNVVGDLETSPPAPFLRRTFSIDREVAQARLYITAFGIYETTINGEPVSDHVYAPGWTDYHRRVTYQALDVTALLRDGENVLGAVLGDGWYCGFVGLQRQTWGDRPRLLAKLVVEFADADNPLVVATDQLWRTTIGPILASDNYNGEIYDARLELGNWDRPGFDDGTWQPVQCCPGFTSVGLRVQPVAALAPPVRRILELRPQTVEPRPNGRVLFDFGQNMVGRVRLRLTAPAGTEVQLRFAEMLDPDGSLHVANLLTARATDRYTCRGGGEETYEPRFTFHGFRYVETDGTELSHDALTGIVVHTDAALAGRFRSSNGLVNQLHRNIQWSLRGNALDVPTDCPQRAERMGWTGDIHVFARTATYLMDAAAFLSKYVTDLRDSQLVGGVDRGSFPWVVPSAFARAGGPGWADAGVIVPWVVYERYGDLRQLERQYPAIRTYIDFLERFAQGRAEGTFLGFGDWLSLDPERVVVDDEETIDDFEAGDSRFGGTPREFLWHAFDAHSTQLAARIAGLLGREDDRIWLSERHERVRAEIAARYLTTDGHLTIETQTAYALALKFDLLPEPQHRRAAEQDLIANVEQVGHLQTGFLGTPHLLEALTRAGRVDLAYELLERTEHPGWLYPVTQGATTVWERWDGWTDENGFHPSPMNSFNHYAYGAVAEWLYRFAAGIDVDPDRGAGYRRILIHPHPGGSLTHASAQLDTHRGRVESSWAIKGDTMTTQVVLPPNTTAVITLPATSPEAVTEHGVPLAEVDGIFDIQHRNGRVECAAISGTYTFAISDYRNLGAIPRRPSL